MFGSLRFMMPVQDNVLCLKCCYVAQFNFLHTDHLGTPQLITDSVQTVVWSADYEPFGQANITTETITNNLRGIGQQYDVETGLIYNYKRYLDPDIGRYYTSDGVELAVGTVTGAVIGGFTLNAAAAASAGSTLVAGSLSRAVVSTSLTGAASSTVSQLATIATEPCAEFSPLQVGLSAIPGPFGVMNPLAISSRFVTGGFVSTQAGGNIAAGLQLGGLGAIRGTTQAAIGIATNPNNSDDCGCKP